MAVTLEDQMPFFILYAPHTPRYKAIAKDIGGIKFPLGYKFPRMMSVYDRLQKRIPTLNKIDFPSARGFGLKDVGQENHPAWGKLRQYQRDTVDLLISTPHPGTLVELSPGLGKSPVSVIAADAAGYNDVLFVAVKSLRLNWEREVRQWTNREVTQRFQEGPVPGWNITNYDTLVGFYNRAHPQPKRDKDGTILVPAAQPIPDPYARHWDLIVLDESVLIKNRKAIRTKAVNVLRAKADHAWCLTGSPTTRYADDLFAQLHFCHPKAFSSYWRFAAQFCILDVTEWGTNVVGTQDNIDFVWELRDVMVSYNQKDVLDLPPLLHEKIDLDLTPEQRKVYDDLLADFVAELESGAILSAPNRMARLTRLQQVVGNLANVDGGDYSSKADAIEELIESGHVQFPLLIWCHWSQGIEALTRRLTDPSFRKRTGISVGVATGKTKDNEQTIEAYKRGEINTLILSLDVGKYGHTLIDTQSVIYVDRTFNADAYYQSLHRLERIGLKHSPQVITLRVPGTVEELNVEENLAGKLETVAHVTEADLAKLMRSLGR